MDSRLVIDSAVLLLYFVIIITIGLRMGRKEDNLEDFALGGRRIPWWAVLASLVAAETSAGTFFGPPGEGFSHRDYTYLQLRRIRPGPRSLVERYRERHPFTLDIAYRDFEPIPLQYSPL